MKIVFTILIVLAFNGIGISQIHEVNSPINNFEKLWRIFDKRYANFDLKKINWNEVYVKYRPLINEKTTNEELFKTACLMLQELNDGHVTIEPNFKENDIECGPPYEFKLDLAFNSEEKFQEFELAINSELVKNGFSEPKGNRITKETNFHYRISDSFGYLRIDEMTENTTFGKFARTIDNAIKHFQKKGGLIIDLRFNGGGWDSNAYKLASRFVTKGETIGHFERTRIKGKDEFTPMKYRKIKSGGKIQFTNQIVILTSDFTASAAEVFLLLMQELPNATIVGDSTEGIFSDMYEFKLPNKWNVTLSHQQYFSESKVNFEGKGITPDIRVLNMSTNIEHQNDPVIEKAIGFLKKATNR